MRIFTKRTLRAFWEVHNDAELPLRRWYKEVEQADWSAPDQVKGRYPGASIIAGNRVVFNIKGNNYRLVTEIDYRYRRVYIRFVGTHAEYDTIDAAEV